MSGKFLGDISSRDAWERLQADQAAVLIDVRTTAEWAFVGGPDPVELGRDVVKVEWQEFPSMSINTGFTDRIREQGVTPDAPLYLLCRSGARSRQAATLLAQNGFDTYNIADGFEGPLDGDGHRGSSSGWKAEGLPWRQS